MEYKLTQEEFNRLAQLRLSISYTSEEVEFLTKIMHDNIPNPITLKTCCKSNLSTFKQKLFGWYLSNKDAIEQYFIQQENQRINDKIKHDAAIARENINNYINDDTTE